MLQFIADVLRNEYSLWLESDEGVIFDMDADKVSLSEKVGLTVKEASLYSGIGMTRLRQIARQPDAKDLTYRVGKRVLFRREALEKYINEHSQF